MRYDEFTSQFFFSFFNSTPQRLDGLDHSYTTRPIQKKENFYGEFR